jgi:hypothetical protein
MGFSKQDVRKIMAGNAGRICIVTINTIFTGRAGRAFFGTTAYEHTAHSHKDQGANS